MNFSIFFFLFDFDFVIIFLLITSVCGIFEFITTVTKIDATIYVIPKRKKNEEFLSGKKKDIKSNLEHNQPPDHKLTKQ